eukprot:scaffold3134_cov414-Prasinococcus_capsulatus_cf.AAC.36
MVPAGVERYLGPRSHPSAAGRGVRSEHPYVDQGGCLAWAPFAPRAKPPPLWAAVVCHSNAKLTLHIRPEAIPTPHRQAALKAALVAQVV